MGDFLIGWDRWLFEAVNQAHRNALFDALMPVLSDKHYLLTPALVAAAVLAARGGSRGRWAVASALLAVALGDFGATWIKILVARPRPCQALAGAMLLGGCGGSHAFPSSHATNMFALAVTLSYHYRRWAGAFLALAAAVAYSRVYLGVHFPLDALGGAVFGAAAAAAALALTEGVGAAWRRRRAAPTVSP